ncbi:uncharacterized protein BDZ99DRAFT_482228 [Mytilinidion resinicola]|uniref:Uncharacterized protein n=1 Tax=Mytilinidion resinicola TaxID=574789 RepID=A0A6A6Y438_9PEZI|nr:uncharacterized protein BDZ99DRAFT_482228 [Mytilinidion resinicola]KAF2803389.1 hypothetical protein BDZ99DRAFT_482228 [Mytilinidion resinicola]
MVVELPYSLHSRYASIAIAWTVIIIPPVFINLGLFYGLWYGKPEIDRLHVLTLPTAVLGIFTAIAIVDRVWKLTRSSPEYRPLNSPRHALDIFQWGYFLALILISALITSALARGDADQDGHDLQIRLISLPAAVLMYLVATLALLSLALSRLELKLPFRFGSLDAGNVVRPAIFYIVEDIVAVDGGGGLEYRKAFIARYDSSPIFRRMIWDLSVVWMLYFYVFAVLLTVLVFTLPKAAVYVVGWAGPFPFAGLLAIWTIFHVKSELRKERKGPLENERTPLLS